MNEIYVGIDESAHARAALRWAVDEAAASGRHVTAVMAWGYLDQRHLEPNAGFDPDYSAETAAEVLGTLVARAVGEPHDVTCRAVLDLPAAALIDAAGDGDLIVVGARGMGGFRGLLLGSVSRRVLHRATAPVAVVRGDQRAPDDAPVVVGIDGSGPSQRALAWAVDQARRQRRPLVAVHAWRVPHFATEVPIAWPDERSLADDAELFVRRQLDGVDLTGVTATTQVVAGSASAALVEAGAAAALVVVGSRGHGQLTSAIFGSVSDQVTHHATAPVVVVP